MNKYHKRVNALYEKTHWFISFEDLCRIKNYFRWRVNEEGFEPEELLSEIAEMNKQVTAVLKSKSTDKIAPVKQLFAENLTIFKAHIYFLVVAQCEEYPNGVWLNGVIGKSMVASAETARKHFEKKGKDSVNS